MAPGLSSRWPQGVPRVALGASLGVSPRCPQGGPEVAPGDGSEGVLKVALGTSLKCPQGGLGSGPGSVPEMSLEMSLGVSPRCPWERPRGVPRGGDKARTLRALSPPWGQRWHQLQRLWSTGNVLEVALGMSPRCPRGGPGNVPKVAPGVSPRCPQERP